MKRVVISGMGPVSAIGTGKSDFWKRLLNHQLCLKEDRPFFNGYCYKSRFFSPLPVVSLKEYHIPDKFERIMQEEDKMALTAAKLAIDDSGINPIILKDSSDGGIVLGTGFSGMENAFDSYTAHLDLDIKTLFKQKPRYHRMIIPMLMPNSVSAWISIMFGIKGPSFTINASCASGTIAIGEAFLKIRNGLASWMITGGVECLKDKFGVVRRGFDVLGTLTQNPDGLPMPFSKKRSGFLFSEGGACILFLEELEHALNRNANIYAEITGFNCTSDAYNPVQMDPDGCTINKMIKLLIKNNTIDYYNSHGTGTLPNDAIEALVIQNLFGNKKSQPYINSSKGIIGHTLGASGAFEALITALSIRESIVHPNIVFDPMDDLNLVPETKSVAIRKALSVSFGFGGHNAALLFQRYPS